MSGAISDWLSSGSTASRARSFSSCLFDWMIAASSRAPSPAISAAWILWRVTTGSGSWVPNSGPMAMPGETGMPTKRRSADADCARA
jgi:hypothetical protein